MSTCIPLAETFSASNIRACEEYVISMQKRLDEAVANNDKIKFQKENGYTVKNTLIIGRNGLPD